MLAVLLAFVVSLAAASLVFHGWRRALGWASASGWLLAFGSTFAWAAALGPEVGACYAIGVFVCLVWSEIALTMEARQAVATVVQRPLRHLHKPSLRACCKQGAIFFLSVPAAGVISMLLSVALGLSLPWSLPLQFTVAILAYPLLWGGLSAWICTQQNLRRPVIVSVTLLALSSLLLYS